MKSKPEDNILRVIDDLPPSYPEAHVKLIDALRDYIRSCENDGEDMLFDGTITKAQYHEGVSLRRERSLLAKLEAFHIDPWLNGMLP